MANYNVYTCQGITIANLRGNMLLTGAGGGDDAVQSCSTVVLVDTGNWRAGLYHFPMGDLDTDQHSRGVIRAMGRRWCRTKPISATARSACTMTTVNH